MKLTKCANGHFYDEEKYSACPHCNGGGAPAGGENDKTVSMMNQSVNTAPPAFNMGNSGNDDVTMPINGFNPAAGNNNVTTPISKPAPAPSNVTQNLNNTAEDEGKTVGYINWNAMQDNKAASMNNQTEKSQGQILRETVNPVVGWLVCVSGNHYGKTFPLFSGRNFIGRDQSMDICLAGDNTISRQKHAVIIYEPKHRKFFAQPGESHELFYRNDEVVLMSTVLEDRDKISVGETTLIFVPFCDERFGWD